MTPSRCGLVAMLLIVGVVGCANPPTIERVEDWHGAVVSGANARALLPVLEEVRQATGFRPAGWAITLHQGGAPCGLTAQGHVRRCHADVDRPARTMALWADDDDGTRLTARLAFCAAGAPRCA